MGHGNYGFVAFITCQFNCHGFIVVFYISIFFLDHSAKKEIGAIGQVSFWKRHSLGWRNKFSDLMPSDWSGSFP